MILRVFPSQTNATPFDEWTRFDVPGIFDPPPLTTEVHISVTFSWDLERGHMLFRAWSKVFGNVKIGGPALGDPGGEFIPGRYLADGNVITSRGCPNKCSYCLAQQREGALREIVITSGYKVQDNNLLACSMRHFSAVMEMLAGQQKRGILGGGLEARRLTPRHIELMASAKIERMYFANDRRGDIECLARARTMLQVFGFPSRALFCYVLIGTKNDSLEAAENRLRETWSIGFMPYAMLYRSESGEAPSGEWRALQRVWVRPAIIRTRMKNNEVGSKYMKGNDGT